MSAVLQPLLLRKAVSKLAVLVASALVSVMLALALPVRALFTPPASTKAALWAPALIVGAKVSMPWLSLVDRSASTMVLSAVSFKVPPTKLRATLSLATPAVGVTTTV